MIRLIGILFIFAASSGTGILMSDKIKNTRERMVKERKMLEEISVLIRFNSMTLKEIAAELNSIDIYRDLGFLSNLNIRLNEKCSFPKAWEISVSEDKTLTPEEKKLLSELGCTLGSTDTEGQLSTLNIYKNRLDEMIESETEKYKVKGKMYRSLGVMFGAMMGILII
ncbi:stage III sporulation protein AB [Porcipelethomonas sp.]|uniref:stage III sporulation protein AB n=1 Tax=Porcipelethomonas sp. TaxID=2981675 RepID=UPI003EF35E5F